MKNLEIFRIFTYKIKRKYTSYSNSDIELYAEYDVPYKAKIKTFDL